VPRSTLAPLLILLGGLLIVLGLLAWAGALSWFGRLPGDIRIERPNTRFYLPITSMVLVSVALSILIALLRRFG
jgi:uncharacterized membrane protein YidH (DUF202 family)